MVFAQHATRSSRMETIRASCVRRCVTKRATGTIEGVEQCCATAYSIHSLRPDWYQSRHLQHHLSFYCELLQLQMNLNAKNNRKLYLLDNSIRNASQVVVTGNSHEPLAP